MVLWQKHKFLSPFSCFSFILIFHGSEESFNGQHAGITLDDDIEMWNKAWQVKWYHLTSLSIKRTDLRRTSGYFSSKHKLETVWRIFTQKSLRATGCMVRKWCNVLAWVIHLSKIAELHQNPWKSIEKYSKRWDPSGKTEAMIFVNSAVTRHFLHSKGLVLTS